ncbi:MAG TPA: phosphoribosylformylglycinamidine synthase, partial [Thermodesulfovibrionia bacterium]|nr:phosphoribosylformylglycinamidine synthase [Thermodesulfovibrionia bacterium]
MNLLHFYRKPALTEAETQALTQFINNQFAAQIAGIETEHCFYVEVTEPMTSHELETLAWLLQETFEPYNFSNTSFFSSHHQVYEVGPRLNFTTSWSANAVSVCHGCGLRKIVRIECSRRYSLKGQELCPISKESFLRKIYDRMTEMPYPLTTFKTGITPQPVVVVPLLEQGIQALMQLNMDMGLGFDEQDLTYYHDLFVNRIGRNPTNVE